MMTQGRKSGEKPSFIGGARREQIVEAAIITLDEIGFVNASMAQIAKRAGISTALISYHFRDKQDLMDHTLMTLIESLATYVTAHTQVARSARDKLHAYLTANLTYQVTYQQRYIALIEIVFQARTAEGVPYYKLDDDEENDPTVVLLHDLLREGQATGEFRPFNVLVMANVIQGTLGEYVMDQKLIHKVGLDAYVSELTAIFDRLILADANNADT
jgi:TetR/AcrR family transcriptional regulator, transcriptional repressor of bet genes